MNFNDCIRENILTETGEKDSNKAQELFAFAQHKLLFWKEVEEKAQKYPSLFLEGYYEIIKELIVAILALDGWTCSNHECLFQYLSEKKPELELDFKYLDEFRKLRNKIDYHGTKVSATLWEQNKLKIQVTIKTLIEYIQKRVD